jgi:hypothetical protein
MQAMMVSVTAAVVASSRPFQWFQRVSEENAATPSAVAGNPTVTARAMGVGRPAKITARFHAQQRFVKRERGLQLREAPRRLHLLLLPESPSHQRAQPVMLHPRLQVCQVHRPWVLIMRQQSSPKTLPSQIVMTCHWLRDNANL